MLELLFALIPVAVILLLSEYLWRNKRVQGERARKFIHILAGFYMAFWPHIISFEKIFLLGSGALLVLSYSRFTKLFHAIYAVRRKTYGELLFAVALMACAYLGEQPWVFTVSILFLALADGGAAVVGRFWGQNNRYKVFGSKHLIKSRMGSIAFVVLCYVSISVGCLVGGHEIIRDNLAVVLVLLPFGALVLENTMPFGLDNLATPLFATLVLNSLL